MKSNNFYQLKLSDLTSIIGGTDTKTTLTDKDGGKHCDTKDEYGCVLVVDCPPEK
ncbi:hypothetical protein OO010_12585 [Flavobacteriaceae bacterium KMM 6898]|nr:hypothetical protein [Flavobacteriaceae bacterium KMM 6898]